MELPQKNFESNTNQITVKNKRKMFNFYEHLSFYYFSVLNENGRSVVFCGFGTILIDNLKSRRLIVLDE